MIEGKRVVVQGEYRLMEGGTTCVFRLPLKMFHVEQLYIADCRGSNPTRTADCFTTGDAGGYSNISQFFILMTPNPSESHIIMSTTLSFYIFYQHSIY